MRVESNAVSSSIRPTEPIRKTFPRLQPTRILEMMKSSSKLTQLFLVSCLLVSLSTVSLQVRLPAVAAAKAQAESDGQSAKLCCCGTADGRCCGMGCCAARAPTRQQSPVSNDTRDDRGPSQLVPKSDYTGHGRAGGWSWQTSSSGLADSSADTSLQAQHVRLDT